MARQSARDDDNTRFFGSAGPAALALSAFGTSALVPVLLITIILKNALAILVALALIALVVYLTLRALRTGYRLDGSELASSRSNADAPIDLRQVKRTARQRRDRLALEMKDGSEVHLQTNLLSLDSAARLRSVMDNEFGIDCATWGVTGSERARRGRDAASGVGGVSQ